MADQSTPPIALLRGAYAAFNSRDIDAVLALMTPDVAWPRAFKGGFARGPEEVRAYWTEQWTEHVGHRFTIERGQIQMMEVCALPEKAPDAASAAAGT